MELYDVRILGEKEPLGIDIAPDFSWKLNSERQNVLQESYHLCITDEANAVVWDSGTVTTRQNVGVLYTGTPLKNRTRYTVSLKVTDNLGEQASVKTCFETAFLTPESWPARWIEPELTAAPVEKPVSMARASLFPPKQLPVMNPCTYLQKEFLLAQPVKRARIYVTAHGCYELTLNGKRVGDRELAPEYSSYDKLLFYQVYDVSGFLKEGQNAIGAVLADGWYCGHIGYSGGNRQYGNQRALLLWMDIETVGGEHIAVVSDKNFRCTDQGKLRYSDLFVGEKQNARMELAGFGLPGLDTSGWKSVREASFPEVTLAAQYDAPIRQIMRFHPVKVLKTPKGETVLDLGQNITGYLCMKVKGSAGTEITLEHSEILDQKGNFLMNIVGMNKHQRDSFILKGEGEEVFEPKFTYHGFRYVRVTGYPGEVTTDAFEAVVLSQDLEETGSLTLSDPRLERLQSNITWSQRGNLIAIPTDCPQREKAGWTGDIQVYTPTAAFNQDVYEFLSRWLKTLRADQFPDGRVPFVSPFSKSYEAEVAGIFKMISAVGWSDACVLVPWKLYQRYGNRRVLAENYEMMIKYTDFLAQKAGDGSWFTQFHYGDWMIPSLAKSLLTSTKSGKATKDLVSHAYLVYVFETFAAIAALMEDSERQKQSLAFAGRYRQIFAQKYVDGSGVLKPDYQGMYVLALAFDLIPEAQREKYLATLEKKIAANGGCLDTGFLSMPLILDVLCDYGKTDLAFRLLFNEKCPSWLYEVKMGATTMWETWFGIRENGKPQNMSFNHYSFGSVGDWMYRRLGGIDFVEPGYRKIRIAPIPGHGLDRAQATLESPCGKIETNWKLSGGLFTLDVSIPCNAMAEIVLPDGTTQEVGSGRYSFHCKA